MAIEIRAILLDFHGVLCALDERRALRICENVKGKLKASPTEVLEVIFHKCPLFREIDSGKLSHGEAIESLRSVLWSGAEDEWRALSTSVWECYEADQRLISLLKSIEAEVSFGILTDNHRDFPEWLRAHPHLFPFSGPIICSGVEGHRKPSSELYSIAAKRIGVEPARILFVDDHEKNVIGASESGMQSLHYSGPESLKACLIDYGLSRTLL